MAEKIYGEMIPIHIASDAHENFDLDHPAEFTIFNNTNQKFTLNHISLEWGTWKNAPKDFISKHNTSSFSAKGTLFGGIEFNVEYVFPDGSFNIYCNISTLGDGYATLTKSNPKDLYEMNIANAGLNTFVVNIGEK